MSRDLDRIIAETVAERPLPELYEHLDDSSRRYLEAQASKARATPEAFYSLSRSRAKLTREEAQRAAEADARALSASLDDNALEALVADVRGNRT